VREIVMMYRQELSDQQGYELFRRAIVERDDEAWTAIHTYFRPLLLGWSRYYCARSPAGEQAEDLADHGLARAWAARAPEQFGRFPNLPTLLAYLRNCVAAAVIDSARGAAVRERLYQGLESRAWAPPEEIVVNTSSRAELWRIVSEVAATEQERIVLHDGFVLALPPRQIQARHPDRFADVAAVYGAKRNLLSRLARCRALQQLRDDLRA